MPGLAPLRRTIAAGETVQADARGSLVFVRRILTAAPAEYGGAGVDSNLDIKVTAVVKDTGEKYEVRMAASEKLRPASEFYYVEINNPQSIPLWIEMYLGVGDFYRPVPDIINVSWAAASKTLAPQDDETNIDTGNAGAVQLLAANPQRMRAIITALASNSDAIRIGDSTVDTDRGVPLQAGESYAINSQAAVYACAETTDAQAAAILEETT